MTSFFDDEDIEDLGGEIRINLPIRTNDGIVCKNLTVDEKILNGKTDVRNEMELGNTTITNKATGKTIFLTSDQREKRDIRNIVDERGSTPLSFLTEITPKLFQFRDEKEKNKLHFGFIAQEVERRFPQMISVVNGKKHVNYIECIPLILEKINKLEEKLAIIKQEKI